MHHVAQKRHDHFIIAVTLLSFSKHVVDYICNYHSSSHIDSYFVCTFCSICL